MDLSRLSILNPQPKRLQGPSLLHHLVALISESTAVEHLQHNQPTLYSYRDFHHAADVLAERISHVCVHEDGQSIVPVLIRQSPHLYIALLAILKAGGAFCPLNLDDPQERISFILKDVCPTVIIASGDLAHLIPYHEGLHVIRIDEPGEPTASKHVKHREATPSDLAYVMYTSGSTGIPKGVGISHLAASQALLAHDRHIPAFSRFLQCAAPTFDISVFEIFFTLFRGCTLVSADRSELLNDLPAVLRRMNVDACELTPTVAASLLRRRESAPTLKFLLTIGEMLNESVIREFGGDDERESMLWAITLQSRLSSRSSTHNIGRPLDTASCFVIEPAESPEKTATFNVMPIGQIGELAIGGYQLADGYLNRPDQTSAAFILTPYGRVYRTGDKARLNADGTLECLGRLSEGQVKLRGQRLELGEVEAAALRTPGCHGSVAAVLDAALVIFCAVDTGVTEDIILGYCKRWLPKSMVPGVVILLEEFPRQPSGKVDRKKLWSSFETLRSIQAADGDDASGETSENERRILSVVAEVLNKNAITKRMTLFEAGLDSLTAIILASSLRAAGFQTNAAQLLMFKSIAHLSSTLQLKTETQIELEGNVGLSLLEDLDRNSTRKSTFSQDKDLVDDILPCTALQTAMLAETARHPGAYWSDIEIVAEIGITAEEFSCAILELIRQNEIMRAGFIHSEGRYVNVVFKAFDRNRIKIVDSFRPLDVLDPDVLLHPLQLQIRNGTSTSGIRVLFQIHHAIYDGWSMDIMLSELSKLLRGGMLQPRPQFRRLIQFSTQISPQNIDNDRAFWSEYLFEWKMQPFPKLSNRSGSGNHYFTKRERLEISALKVDSAVMQTECSVQSYFMAALAIVWSGILGNSEVVIGSVMSGRTIPVDNVEEILGPCIASMPLRIDLAQASNVLDVLMSIKSSNRKIMEHLSLPLLEIKKLIGPQGSEGLYDVLFVYQQSLYSAQSKQNLFKEVQHLDRLETKFLFEVEPQDDAFTLQATHHSSLISTDVVTQVLQQVKEVFCHLLGHETESISTIRHSLKCKKSIDNETPRTMEHESDLAFLFEAAVARVPHSDAVCFSTSLSTGSITATTMSFDALNRFSNRIAHHLLDQGIEPGQVIAVIMEKSPLFYASVLGVAKARCAYLPLLPSTPTPRIEAILASGKIERCLVDKTSSHILNTVKHVQSMDIESQNFDKFSDSNPGIDIDSSRLAYVIYTSGTTGVPKGVAVTQRNIVANILHLGSIYPTAVSNPPRLLQICSQSFDVSVFEIFYTWHVGMCLCAASNDLLFGDIENAIRDFKITHLSMTPTVASLVNPKNVPSVEFLVTAGEPMTAAVLERWGELLWQGYGPSETTNICSVKKMKHGENIEHLGWVFPNTSVVVMEPRSLKPLPFGWVGEFCFGGDQVAAGYLNVPQLTAEKFIEHPEFGRIYRSGDLGRMLPNGSLIIMGRIDGQIKLRGQRIETAEVSSVITGTSLAVEAVTMLLQEPNSPSAQLTSFYVCHHTTSEDFTDLEVNPDTHQRLFAQLTARLPSYMIPSYLVPISRIPLTSNGKVDGQRLVSCFISLPGEYKETVCYAMPIQDNSEWTEIERAIADVISVCLDIPQSEIGRWTPFARLGLHSLSAISVTRKLTSKLNVRIPISSLLQNPTVAQLAKFVTAIPVTNGGPTMTNRFADAFIQEIKEDYQLQGHEIEEIFPCSPLQEAMLSQGQHSYYNRILLELHIEPDDLRQYWVQMVKRHGILRTCFATSNDPKYPIVQVVLHRHALPWKHVTITSSSFLDSAIQDQSKTLLEPIDSKMPPFSISIIASKESTYLSFICHHSLYDGVAIENLWREIEALARGNILPLPVSYAPFCQRMLELPNDTEKFWINHLWGFTPSDLCIESAQKTPIGRFHSSSFHLPYNALQRQIRSLGTSLLSLCQAAWAQVLSACFDRYDICFGCVMSGRTLDIDGLDQLVAPCFNTVPVRRDISLDANNIELAKAFQSLNSDLLPYQFTPLRMIQRVVGTQGRRLFDTLLLLQPPLKGMDEKIWTLGRDDGEMDVPLVCEIIPCPGSSLVTVNLHYHNGSIDEDSVAALSEAFKEYFRQLLESPFTGPVHEEDLPPGLLRLRAAVTSRRHSPIESAKSNSLGEEQWSEDEALIRQVLADLSGMSIQKIRRDTSIFQLGLDSINAVQVASMLRRQGSSISASDVIEHQSCEKLAHKLCESRNVSPSMLEYDLDKFAHEIASQVREKVPNGADIEAVLPCTPIQCAMMASFGESNGESYLNMVSFALDGSVEKGELIASWKALRSCHPMLRTGFISVRHSDCSFAMVRYHDAPEGHQSTEYERIQDLDPSKTSVSRWKREMTSNILSTFQLPPWRVAVSTGPTGSAMHVLAHHALYDAQSLESMLAGLSGSLSGQRLRAFPPVEKSLQSILTKALYSQDDSRSFWEQQAELTVVNKFPIMTPLRENTRATLYYETLSSMRFSALRSVTQKQGISIQALLQAAWTRILSSYLGEDSVVFGVTLSGRTTDKTKDAPLPCMVTVPIIAANQYFNRDLVSSMMQYNKELHKHQFAPLVQIQKWLGYPATQIFDTLLVYQRLERDQGHVRPWRPMGDDARVDYPLSIEVKPLNDNNIRLAVTFFNDILPLEQAKLLLAQFDAMMRHIATDVDGHEDGIYRTHPDVFAITPPAMPVIPAPVEFLHQFVELRALSHPDDPALEFVSRFDGEMPIRQTWTYAEFDKMGNRVANLLKGEATVGSIVAIHFEKCPEAYVAILGILKAGCSFAALDPNAPKSRKDFIMSDSQAPCLLVSSQCELDFEVSSKIIRIDLDGLAPYSHERRDLGIEFTPDSTCYCLYTSGTTGTPKGCEITHENCVQAMMAFQNLFDGHWQENSRWLQFAALHFDVSVLEQYWSWSVGITVVAAPRDLILDNLIASINRLEITHIDLTPSLARLTHPDEVPALCRGVFITGGESLKQEILDAWGPKAVIYNAYGPTEATIGVTMYQRVPVNGRPSNIGRQFLNVGSYVFRRGTEIPVLRGGVGELCVSGKLVGKGYLNRQELTKERFPTLSEFGEKIYRTGDLVRILHDGCFDFLGRADDQVKLRGQRLEIGEINHVIRTGAPEVKDVATIVVRYGTGHKDFLVSFLVKQGDHRGKPLGVLLHGEEKLCIKARAACREKLPSYMVPTYFLVLPYIPLSPNNKVETKELKALFNGLSPEQLVKITAATSLSRKAGTASVGQIAGIIAEFCQLDRHSITASTSIFDLGIDSITALQLSTFFKDQGMGSCHPATLLRNPVVADLADALSEHERSGSVETLIWESKQMIQAYRHRHLAPVCRSLTVPSTDVEYIAPCSALQRGIISRSIAGDLHGAYFNSFTLELEDGTSAERLRSAWSEVVASQAILRTCFVKTVDGYVQAALMSPRFHWKEREVQGGEDVDRVVKDEREEWIGRNNDEFPSPLEFMLLTGPNMKQCLVIYIFHALYDGNSFETMMQQVKDAYHGRKTTKGPPFLEALCYGPLWRHDRSREFWTAHLTDWRPSPVPTIPGFPGSEPARAVRVISGSGLETVRRRNNVTLQSVTMALWARILQQFFPGVATIGIIVAGRSIDLPHVENTVGPLFNTVPFFNKSLRGRDWAWLIRKCHDFNTSVLPFQHVSLKSIQKWCSGGRPLFDSVFVFSVDKGASGDELELWTVKDGPLNPDFPLGLEARRRLNGDLDLSLVAQGRIASVSMLEDMLQQVDDSVASMVADQPLELNAAPELNARQIDEGQDAFVDGETNNDTFVWTAEALAFRRNVAALANVSVEDVAATTTMLELGLDSVDIIQLSAKLRSNGINVSASAIMRHQTILRISHKIGVCLDENLQDVLVNDRSEELTEKLRKYAESRGINVDQIEAVLPPTHLQESMVAGMVHSDFEWYFNHDVLEVANGTDIQKLGDAWMRLIEKSPILRTGFLEVEDRQLDMGYCQIVKKHSTLSIGDELHAESLSDVDQLIRRAKDEARGKDGIGELLQLQFFTCRGRRYVLVSMAHALYDGWSLGLMYRDLEAEYRGESRMRTPWQPLIRKLLASQTRDGNPFWTSYLDGAQPAMVQMREPGTPGEKPHRREEVSANRGPDISDFCKKQRITLQTLLQGCWAALLAHQMGNMDVTFGVVLSGRDFENAEDLLFPTINTVPLRCIMHGTPPEFLQYLEAMMAEIRDHQAYPLRRMQTPDRVPGADLFNTLFILQKALGQAEPMLLKSIGGSSAVDYPVCVEAEMVGSELVWRVACQAHFLTEHETLRLVRDLDRVLTFMMGCDTSLLAFRDDEVSVCGLPHVSLATQQTQQTAVAKEGEGDEAWSETASAIREVLGYVADIPVDAIPGNVSLYHLGLDSISALKVCSLLRKRGIHINPRGMLKATSILQMARAAALSFKEDQTTAIWTVPHEIGIDDLLVKSGISREDVDFILPALPMQVYMISAWQNAQGSLFFPEFQYSMPRADAEGVIRAWDELVAQLPILRTCFLATTLPEIPFVQVALKPGRDAVRPLVHVDVSAGQRVTIRLQIHHALYDAISLPAILRLLSEKIQGRAVLDEGISDWSNFAIRTASKDARQARKSFWTDYLRDAPRTNGESTASCVAFLKKAALADTTRLRSMAAQHGVSVQAIFLAAYAKALAQDEVVFGVYLANRETLPTPYPSLNIVPLKVRNGPLLPTAQAIQDDLHAINSHGDVGLWEIAHWTGIKISSFVNFLVPQEGTGDLLAESPGQSQYQSPLAHPHMQGNVVGHYFPAGMDVEASIHGGEMDIGIFGCCAEDEATALVERVVAYLQG